MQYLFTYLNDGRERSKLRVDYRLFEVLHVVFDVFPASGNDGVAFVLQPRFLDFSTPGILGIQLTVVFYGPPVRDITMHFFGRIRDDGDEDAGGEGAAVLRVMFGGQLFADLGYGDEASFGHLSHDGLHLECWCEYDAVTGLGTHGFQCAIAGKAGFQFQRFREIVVTEELFLPHLLLIRHTTTQRER
jgi:hypothetical protein